MESCRVDGQSRAGLFLDSWSEAAQRRDFLPNLIAGSTFTRCHYGIQAVKALVLNIVGCQFFQTKHHAIHLDADGGYDGSNSVLISGCRVRRHLRPLLARNQQLQQHILLADGPRHCARRS